MLFRLGGEGRQREVLVLSLQIKPFSAERLGLWLEAWMTTLTLVRDSCHMLAARWHWVSSAKTLS